MVKEAGFRSGVARGTMPVSVHWHAGLGNTIRGTTKNFFAATGFKLWIIVAQVLGTLLMFVFPVAALPFARGWALAFAAIPVRIAAHHRSRRGDQIESAGRVCADVSARGGHHLLDADAINGGDAVAGRGYVARDVLSD